MSHGEACDCKSAHCCWKTSLEWKGTQGGEDGESFPIQEPLYLVPREQTSGCGYEFVHSLCVSSDMCFACCVNLVNSKAPAESTNDTQTKPGKAPRQPLVSVGIHLMFLLSDDIFLQRQFAVTPHRLPCSFRILHLYGPPDETRHRSGVLVQYFR